MRRFLISYLSSLIFYLSSLTATAQNPIIRDQFTADPTARVFDGRIYLYPSHDIPAPEGVRQDWFCMADYHVFSSDDLMEWRDHGIIVTQNAVPWGKPDAYSMWAPDCVCKDGRYYFYFPNAPKEGRGFAIGVATADSPTGPFTCEPEPIKGVAGIDPCVLIDDDGSAYIYWSGMGIRAAKLKDNMLALDGESRIMEGLPEGFKEGPFAFKREGHYYLTFPWVRREGGTETLAYAMSDTPLGPWSFKGIIMAEHPNRCWTNHHSIVQYHDQWLLFYHHNDYSPRFDKLRSAHIDHIRFNADGTIQEVKPTLRGVGICLATRRIEVDHYSTTSEPEGLSVQFNDTLSPFLGWHVILPAKSSLTFADVDFSTLHTPYLTACIRAQENTILTVSENIPNGKVIARIPVQVITDGQFRRDYRGRWLTVTAPLQYIPQGIANLCLSTQEHEVAVDWIQFKNRPAYFTATPPNAAPAYPDDEGFIRRWRLLEPINKPNPSNTVFTDTYLKDAFYETYFKDQLTIVPRDGQNVKVRKQTLTWHSIDSERYNIKLFRFADLMGKQTYGVLFWGVTVIECNQDISDVRLAAGSNGASLWWLNGQEVLLLSGDRRMVCDDAVSPRLTLHKGTNILRCALINGPGMSDFCVRFIDEKGAPVTNFQIR